MELPPLADEWLSPEDKAAKSSNDVSKGRTLYQDLHKNKNRDIKDDMKYEPPPLSNHSQNSKGTP